MFLSYILFNFILQYSYRTIDSKNWKNRAHTNFSAMVIFLHIRFRGRKNECAFCFVHRGEVHVIAKAYTCPSSVVEQPDLGAILICSWLKGPCSLVGSHESFKTRSFNENTFPHTGSSFLDLLFAITMPLEKLHDYRNTS